MKEIKGFKWCNKLKQCGCKLTLPRQGIITFLTKNPVKHFTADEIYFELKKKFPNIGLTTIYRTLELLVQNGLLSKFEIGDGKSRYEISADTTSADHHHHLTCIKCGKIINYNNFIEEEIDLLKKIEVSLSKQHKFKITNHVIQFQGICHDCK
jgi:Fur family transcriptional regulator, ferric uptake regulator